MSRLNHASPTPEEFAEAERVTGHLEGLLKAEKNRAPKVSEIVKALVKAEVPIRVKTAAVLLQIGSQTALESDPSIEGAIKEFVDKILATPKPQEDQDPDLYSQFLLQAFTGVADKWDHVTSMRLEGQLELESKARNQDLPQIKADFEAVLLPVPHYQQVVRCIHTWYELYAGKGHINGDLSSYLGRPAKSYSGKTLRCHLKEQVLVEQPQHITSLWDLLHDEELYV
jgi:hypothetical protein